MHIAGRTRPTLDTRPRECTTTCDEPRYGSAILAVDAAVDLERFEVIRSELASLRLLGSASASLGRGMIQGHPIGIDAGTTMFDPPTQASEVRFVDVARNIGRSGAPRPPAVVPMFREQP